MNTKELAKELKKIFSKDEDVSLDLIDALTDDLAIDEFCTCSCCGGKIFNVEQVKALAEEAGDINCFLTDLLLKATPAGECDVVVVIKDKEPADEHKLGAGVFLREGDEKTFVTLCGENHLHDAIAFIKTGKSLLDYARMVIAEAMGGGDEFPDYVASMLLEGGFFRVRPGFWISEPEKDEDGEVGNNVYMSDKVQAEFDAIEDLKGEEAYQQAIDDESDHGFWAWALVDKVIFHGQVEVEEPRRAEKTIQPNDPCPCGKINPNTGKPIKYKKCSCEEYH
jgi:hypothetical protein